LFGRMRPDVSTTGIDGHIARIIQAKSRPLNRAVTTWVKPKLVAEVKFIEWTTGGEMRHAVFLGLRAEDVTREVEKPRGKK
jgi:ATP-dependent DNA ligase